jgi:hypothetical protein
MLGRFGDCSGIHNGGVVCKDFGRSSRLRCPLRRPGDLTWQDVGLQVVSLFVDAEG